jgi:hypothetical protein
MTPVGSLSSKPLLGSLRLVPTVTANSARNRVLCVKH